MIAKDGVTVNGRIVIYYSDDVTVENFKVHLNIPTSWGGVSVIYGNNARVLKNDVFEAGSVSGRGIYVFQSTGSIIKNNYCSGVPLNGIILFYSSKNTISQNTSIESSVGIHLVESSNNILSNNTCKNNRSSGIIFSNGSDYNIAKENRCIINGYSGMFIQGDQNTIGQGNKSLLNGSFGIAIGGSNHRVFKNQFHCSGNQDILDGSTNSVFRDNSTGPLPECE